MSKHKENKIPILSFYSGGGFMDMGFEEAGFEIVWTNEVDESFARLHSEGITSWRKSFGNGVKAEIFNTKSITEISSSEIYQEAFPYNKPKVFGIIGGPPCQDFSINGSRKGFSGERGKLTVHFINKILDLLPTFFVMENVTGLIRSESNRKYLDKLLQGVRNQYYLESKVLNALDFGVPQSRQRVFFIGIKKENMKGITNPEEWFTWPSNEKYFKSLTKYNWPKVNTFGETPQKPKDVPMELCVINCLINTKDFNRIPNANEYFDFKVPNKKLNEIKEGETNRPSFRRLHRFRYSPTTCYGNNEVHLHPFENRRISVREALRIQGVSDNYVLPKDVPISKKFRIISNGVPVPLANAVATSVKIFLEKNHIV